jgi:hypothetical protein
VQQRGADHGGAKDTPFPTNVAVVGYEKMERLLRAIDGIETPEYPDIADIPIPRSLNPIQKLSDGPMTWPDDAITHGPIE